jgi:hypothetical protein
MEVMMSRWERGDDSEAAARRLELMVPPVGRGPVYELDRFQELAE